MRIVLILLFCLSCGSSFAQDPWKNIYSRNAWAERDKWQKAEALTRLLDITPGSVVADVGCHEGYMTFKLAKVVRQGGTVYAVDVDAIKLEKVKKYALENGITQIKTVKGEYGNPKDRKSVV